jgi:DNA repair exonuclease SbcCD ATPase subunit
MVWAMDGQIAKLDAGNEHLQRSETAIARMQELARAAEQDLARAAEARESFRAESSRIETNGRGLIGDLRSTLERLAIDRQEMDAFDQRLRGLAQDVAGAESRMQGVLAKDDALLALQQKADAVSRNFETLSTQAGELTRQHAELQALSAQLAKVEGLATRTAAQHEALLQARSDIEAMRGELAQFHNRMPKPTSCAINWRATAARSACWASAPPACWRRRPNCSSRWTP